MESNHPTVPLNDDDIALLKQIYQGRKRLLIQVFGVLLVVAAYCAYQAGNYSLRYHILSFAQGFILCFSILGGILAICIGTMYKRRVSTVHQDLKSGVKEIVTHTIMSKQQFENTGQFFIGLDHPDYLFHEIDFESWSKVDVGEQFALYRAPLSKYFFNAQGKYTAM